MACVHIPLLRLTCINFQPDSVAVLLLPAAAPPEDYLPTCDAFAHWTYWATQGRVMVTDVQGWFDKESNLVRLTDPCVHCPPFHGLVDDQHKDRSLVSAIKQCPD